MTQAGVDELYDTLYENTRNLNETVLVCILRFSV